MYKLIYILLYIVGLTKGCRSNGDKRLSGSPDVLISSQKQHVSTSEKTKDKPELIQKYQVGELYSHNCFDDKAYAKQWQQFTNYGNNVEIITTSNINGQFNIRVNLTWEPFDNNTMLVCRHLNGTVSNHTILLSPDSKSTVARESVTKCNSNQEKVFCEGHFMSLIQIDGDNRVIKIIQSGELEINKIVPLSKSDNNTHLLCISLDCSTSIQNHFRSCKRVITNVIYLNYTDDFDKMQNTLNNDQIYRIEDDSNTNSSTMFIVVSLVVIFVTATICWIFSKKCCNKPTQNASTQTNYAELELPRTQTMARQNDCLYSEVTSAVQYAELDLKQSDRKKVKKPNECVYSEVTGVMEPTYSNNVVAR